MSFSIRTLIAASISLLPLALASAVAQADPVPFDFTAVVTGGDTYNGQITAGEAMSGTLAFNPNDADLEAGGPIGSNNWSLGTGPGGPVFEITAQVGNIAFSYGAGIDGLSGEAATTSTSYNVYSAATGHLNNSAAITIQTPYGSPLPWDGNGLPVPTSTFDAGSGGFVSMGTPVVGEGLVEFQFTSISLAPTAAPEIDPASAASGLALLLGSLVVLRGRRPSNRVAA